MDEMTRMPQHRLILPEHDEDSIVQQSTLTPCACGTCTDSVPRMVPRAGAAEPKSMSPTWTKTTKASATPRPWRRCIHPRRQSLLLVGWLILLGCAGPVVLGQDTANNIFDQNQTAAENVTASTDATAENVTVTDNVTSNDTLDAITVNAGDENSTATTAAMGDPINDPRIANLPDKTMQQVLVDFFALNSDHPWHDLAGDTSIQDVLSGDATPKTLLLPYKISLPLPSSLATQADWMLYHMFDEAFTLNNGTSVPSLVLPPHKPVAHVWAAEQHGSISSNNDTVTENTTAVWQFLDATVSDGGNGGPVQYATKDGIILIIDQPLIPPGMLPLVNYTTKLAADQVPIQLISSLLLASGWVMDEQGIASAMDASKVLPAVAKQGEGNGSQFTMFLPTDVVLNDSTTTWKQDVERLRHPLWHRHLEDFLFSLITEGDHDRVELQQLVQEGADLKLTMVNGFNRILTKNRDATLAIDGKSFWDGWKYVSTAYQEMRGVDGYIQIVESAPMPHSLQYDLYELLGNNSDLSTMLSAVDSAQLKNDLKSLEPMTFFAPLNSALDAEFLTMEGLEDLVKNHMFFGLLYSDELRSMQGKTVLSLNEKQWLVDVAEGDGNETIRLINQENNTEILVEFATGAGSTNNLARNGVLHVVNRPLQEEPPSWNESSNNTTAPPTDGGAMSKEITISSAFVVYTMEEAVGVWEIKLGLILAYADFVQKVVADGGSGQRRSQFLRRRRLTVTLIAASPDIAEVQNTPCTGATVPVGAICYAAFGQYKLVLLDEDENAVFQQYLQFTNAAIDQGNLQDSLDEVYPGAPFKIAGNADAEPSQTDAPASSPPPRPYVPVTILRTCPPASFCPPGMEVPEPNREVVIDRKNDKTCGSLEQMTDFTAFPCPGVLSMGALCCTKATNELPLPAERNSTSAPTPKTTEPGTIVFSIPTSFRISNTAGLSAEFLEFGADRQGLNAAFADFVQVLFESEGGSRRLQHIRLSRRLSDALDIGSADVYLVEDETCQPPLEFNTTRLLVGSANSTNFTKTTWEKKCQIAYGRYDLFLPTSNTTMEETVFSHFVNLTRVAIERGDLQNSLDRVDPGSPIVVEGSGAQPAPLKTEPPRPVQVIQVGSDFGLEFAASVGIIVIVLVVALCCNDYLGNHAKHAPVEEVDPWEKEESHAHNEQARKKGGEKDNGPLTEEEELAKYAQEIESLLELKCPAEAPHVDMFMELFAMRELYFIGMLKQLPDAYTHEEKEKSQLNGALRPRKSSDPEQAPPASTTSSKHSDSEESDGFESVHEGWLDDDDADEFYHEPGRAIKETEAPRSPSQAATASEESEESEDKVATSHSQPPKVSDFHRLSTHSAATSSNPSDPSFADEDEEWDGGDAAVLASALGADKSKEPDASMEEFAGSSMKGPTEAPSVVKVDDVNVKNDEVKTPTEDKSETSPEEWADEMDVIVGDITASSDDAARHTETEGAVSNEKPLVEKDQGGAAQPDSPKDEGGDNDDVWTDE